MVSRETPIHRNKIDIQMYYIIKQNVRKNVLKGKRDIKNKMSKEKRMIQ